MREGGRPRTLGGGSRRDRECHGLETSIPNDAPVRAHAHLLHVGPAWPLVHLCARTILETRPPFPVQTIKDGPAVVCNSCTAGEKVGRTNKSVRLMSGHGSARYSLTNHPRPPDAPPTQLPALDTRFTIRTIPFRSASLRLSAMSASGELQPGSPGHDHFEVVSKPTATTHQAALECSPVAQDPEVGRDEETDRDDGERSASRRPAIDTR